MLFGGFCVTTKGQISGQHHFCEWCLLVVTIQPALLPEIKKPRESPDNDSFGDAEQPRSAGVAETSCSMMCEAPPQASLLTSQQGYNMAAGKPYKRAKCKYECHVIIGTVDV